MDLIWLKMVIVLMYISLEMQNVFLRKLALI